MDNLYDVIVIGGGPAGLTAALYLARAKYRVLVLEKEQFGGQISITHELVNYPGVVRTSGKQLTDTIQHQAGSFGAEFLLAEAIAFDLSDDIKIIHTNRGIYRCFGVLLATGAHPRTIGFPGEEEYKGRGVAYCATCDGEFFTGKEVFVVGGGYAAAEESVFLTKFARHVTILVRKNDFSCAASVAEQAKNHEKITVLTNTVMEEVSGENGLTYARYKNTVTGEVTEYKSNETFGVFIFAGYSPATEAFKDIVALNEQGYILTDNSLKTSIEGVYAAGDVCVKPLRQVVTATGDGALAATELEKYVASIHQRTGLRAQLPNQNETSASSNISSLDTPEPNSPFSEELRRQLEPLLARLESSINFQLTLDNRPVSKELEQFISAFAGLSDKLSVSITSHASSTKHAPCVAVFLSNGENTGLAFHGVPTGHEFTSFVLGLYNAAGPGQPLDDELDQRIKSISKKTDMKILVTLSCTMCPDLVIAAQKIAARNPLVSAQVYDIQHFEYLKDQYRVMSVPCLVINDDIVSFGKKNIPQILDMMR